jgi:hypothetical protein
MIYNKSCKSGYILCPNVPSIYSSVFVVIFDKKLNLWHARVFVLGGGSEGDTTTFTIRRLIKMARIYVNCLHHR